MSSPGAPPAAPAFEASKCARITARALASVIERLLASRAGPDRLAGLCDLSVEGLHRGEVDLREGGERRDGVGKHVERDARADGEGGLLEPLAGLGAEGVGAGQPLAVA